MNILILGNGAREMVIKEKLELNNNIIFLTDIKDFNDIYNFCIINFIKLVIPSSEEYLCNGIVDFLLDKDPLILVFGPNKYQSKLEGSKVFSKQIMKNLDIPTANYTIFNKNEIISEYNYLSFPVLKYSGLARGKGVYLPNTLEEFEENLQSLKNIGDEEIILEDRLYGEEVSIMAFCNGKEAFLMPQSQDYKKKNDGEKGLNTGGMGAICPVNILTSLEINIVKKYLNKIVEYFGYKGVLYAGIMKCSDNIYFLEFNCRLGDPEAQVILNLIDETCNFLDIILHCINGEKVHTRWKNHSAVAVVLSHIDYPLMKSSDNLKITYIDKLDDNIRVYNSNVSKINNINYTTGGRVLTMVCIDLHLYRAIQCVYNNIYKISYHNCFYRRDIGYKYCLDKIEKIENNRLENSSVNKKLNIAVMSSGNGTSIQKLLDNKEYIVKIIVSNNKNAGVFDKAKHYNIPYMYVNLDTDKEFGYTKIINILRLYDINLVLLVGYMKIVPEIFFKEFYTINIHPSLLPKYGKLTGDKIHKLCIENKDYSSGCTLHEVTEKVDEGRILLQKQYLINSEDNSKTLKENIQKLENDIILDYVKIYENNNKNKFSYNVDVDEGNKLVKDIKNVNEEIGGFCGIFNYKNIKLAASTDGCGSKIDLADKFNYIDTIGIDLVAMNINDLIAGGAKPLFFMDYIAIDKMDREKCRRIINSINNGCKIANCKLIGGETAEMHGIYLKDKFDLAGFAVGEIIYELPKIERMNSSCLLYALKSSGIHSNGYTLINDLLKNNSLIDVDLDELMMPTKIYMEVLEICEKYHENILGISNITGGGFKDNIRRILPNNLDFELIDWEFPKIFKWIQKLSGLTKSEMLEIYNCGYGMVIISDKKLEIEGLYEIGKLKENYRV